MPLIGGYFGLRTAFEEHRFVTAPNDSQSPLVASGGSGTSVSPAEKFWFDWETSGFGRARLMWAEPFRYVRAENAGSSPLFPNSQWAGTWETFTLLWNADGTFSLQAHPEAGGKFVAAPPTWFGGPLIADRAEIGPWEKFDLVSAGSGVVW